MAQLDTVTRQRTAALRAGDPAAFDAIFHTFRGQVYATARKILRDPALAEEAVQEVFVQLWTHRQRLDPDKSIGGYLYRMTRNLVISMLRERAQAAAAELTELPAPERAEDLLVKHELQALLDEALQKLSPRQREVFQMSRFQAMSYAEIAAALGISTDTVEVHMSAALRVIRQQLRYSAVLAALLASWVV